MDADLEAIQRHNNDGQHALFHIVHVYKTIEDAKSAFRCDWRSVSENQDGIELGFRSFDKVPDTMNKIDEELVVGDEIAFF